MGSMIQFQSSLRSGGEEKNLGSAIKMRETMNRGITQMKCFNFRDNFE
jgi:hypothetical protein